MVLKHLGVPAFYGTAFFCHFFMFLLGLSRQSFGFHFVSTVTRGPKASNIKALNLEPMRSVPAKRGSVLRGDTELPRSPVTDAKAKAPGSAVPGLGPFLG